MYAMLCGCVCAQVTDLAKAGNIPGLRLLLRGAAGALSWQRGASCGGWT